MALGTSSNNGNGNSGDDDADDGEPTDVALTQPGGFTKGFSKNCFKCGKKGHMAKDCASAGGGNNNNGGTGPNARNCKSYDTAAFRLSIGAGVIWASPFGPLRFEAAYPVLKADYDKTEWFRFSVGTAF